jgi:hypothetical protein
MRSWQVADYPFNVALAGSIEGCGVGYGEVGSQGLVQMIEAVSRTPWISRAGIEVRDHYSANRIFVSKRGLGRYHMIDSNQSRCEFSLMYRNNTGHQVDKIEFFLQPTEQFDLLAFKELAASHTFTHELLGTGLILLVGQDLALFPEEQVHFRFEIDLHSSGSDQEFLKIDARGVANDSIPISLFRGFYNRNVVNDIRDISPFVSIDNGRIIGRGHTWEFNNDLHILDNGTVLYTGSTHEFGVDPRAIVIAANPDNAIIWQHEYAFSEGGALLRRIMPAGEGRILLIGTIDDNQILDNYITDAYACMLMLNKDGEELWRRVWKPGNGAYVGGSLNNGHFYHEDKILLLGFRYTANGGRQFLMETDINGEIHWIRDFILGTDYWGYPVAAINKIPMKVSSFGNVFVVGGDGFDSFIVKLDSEGNITATSTYFDNAKMEQIYINDFDVLDNEGLILVGNGYSYDADYNITNFGMLVQLDADLSVISEEKILDRFYDIELNDIMVRDSMIFAAGAVRTDSSSGTDAVIIRSGLKGAEAQIVRIADFGARDYGYRIDVSADGRVFAGVQTQTVDIFYNLQMGYFWAADTLTSAQDIRSVVEPLHVFPNPATDVISISLQETIDRVNAYAMDGTFVQLRREGGNTYSVRHLPPGHYLIVVYGSDNTRYLTSLAKIE